MNLLNLYEQEAKARVELKIPFRARRRARSAGVDRSERAGELGARHEPPAALEAVDRVGPEVVLERGALRRTHLRGRENVQKRYLVHVAGFNLGLMMRLMLGAGTPKELAARGGILFWLFDPATGLALHLILPPEAPPDP